MALSDEIKERLDIVDVVTGYVPSLQRAGRNHKAPCPFHAERTPSFVVFPERQSWRCFGACATGGDVLSFVMRMEKLTFADTLALLATRTGVSRPRSQQSRQHINVLHRINASAAAFFQGVLRSGQGIAARAYLQQRGLDAETIDGFQLGLSPGSGTTLKEHLVSLGHAEEQIVAAGLVMHSEDAPDRDMFVSRLMFPIHDDQGNVAGFGARSLDGSEPKYLNSPRTEIFDKGRILYALHRAKGSIREQWEGVVVEGYMDAIAAHQYGCHNVVASMGTALTEHQVALLKRFGKRFVMAMDADAAGRQATFRSLRDSWLALSGATDVSLGMVLLPFGKDPDELIRADVSAWRRSVAESKPLLDYLFDSVPGVWDLSTSAGKQQVVDELRHVVYSMGNVFDVDTSYRRLAYILEVSVETLKASFGSGRPQGASPSRRVQQRPAVAAPGTFEADTRDLLTEHTVAMVLQWPDLRRYVLDLDTDCLERWEDRQLFTSWLKCSSIGELQQGLDEDLQQRAEYYLSLPLPPMDLHEREQAVMDCSHHLEVRRLRRLKEEEGLVLGQDAGDVDGVAGLEAVSEQVIETNERLRRLFHGKPSYQSRS